MNAPFHVTRVEAALGRATARIAELEDENQRLRDLLRLDFPGTPIEWKLTPKENDLLLAIASVAPCSLSTPRALNLVWPYEGVTPRVVSVHISRIRGKLKPFGLFVRTSGRMGYYLDKETLGAIKSHRLAVDTARTA